MLVGGRSTRMGRDKALLPAGTSVLAAMVARQVELAAGSATLIGDPLRYGNLGYPAIADAYGEQGPLGGILTALAHSKADWSLVTACDMPNLTATFLVSLLASAAGSDASAVVAAGPSGLPEPLCAVFHRRARTPLEAAFARGVRRAGAVLSEVPASIFKTSETSIFQNVNTPEEWAAYGR